MTHESSVLEKRYVSVDVETAGSVPGKYSMLALGACMVDDPSITFYRELRPINLAFQVEALRVGVVGLHALVGLNIFSNMILKANNLMA